MSFKRRPETPDAWVSEAPLKSTAADPERPWEAFDPKEAPCTTFNLRLNRYELELLRVVADKQRRSQQQTAKSILIPALRRAALAEDE